MSALRFDILPRSSHPTYHAVLILTIVDVIPPTQSAGTVQNLDKYPISHNCVYKLLQSSNFNGSLSLIQLLLAALVACLSPHTRQFFKASAFGEPRMSGRSKFGMSPSVLTTLFGHDECPVWPHEPGHALSNSNMSYAFTAVQCCLHEAGSKKSPGQTFSIA